MSSTTVRAPRRELTDEQKNIQEQARTVVKILGLLDTLNEFNLGHIKDACDRRMKVQSDPNFAARPLMATKVPHEC